MYFAYFVNDIKLIPVLLKLFRAKIYCIFDSLHCTIQNLKLFSDSVNNEKQDTKTKTVNLKSTSFTVICERNKPYSCSPLTLPAKLFHIRLAALHNTKSIVSSFRRERS